MYAIDIMSRLIKGTGTEGVLDATTPISFPTCLHPERKQLLHRTMLEIHKSLVIYGMIPELTEEQPIDTGNNPFLLDNVRAKKFGSVPSFRVVSRQLEEAMLRCDQCGTERRGVVEKALRPIADILMVTGRPKRIAGGRGDPSRMVISNEDEELVETGEMDSEDEDLPMLKPTEFLAKPQPIPRTQRASVPVYNLVDAASEVRMRKFDLKHDDYDTGPTAEDTLAIHRELIVCFDNQPEDFKWISMMLRFRDHGYRVLPGSLDQFYLDEPSPRDQLAHLFPTPPSHDVNEWRKRASEELALEDIISLGNQSPLPESCITGSDMVQWGLKDMINSSGPEGSVSSMMAYVTGRVDMGSEESSYIRLDMMKDRVWPQAVEISMDIDSVIWLATRLKVAGVFNLHTSPYRKERPPISIANHVYVELLWPRTDEDVAGGRISGGAKQVPLSNLPNTHFATFGRVEGAPNIAVVFPRMKHRYPLRSYWETKLPQEVELLWLRNVVYGALHRLEDNGIKPYVGLSYEDTKWRHVGAQETTQVLAHEHLEQLQDHIDAILEENHGDPSYDCFRSYFFVLEIRGIKVATSSDDLESKDPWDSLVRNYPAFDWEYMEDTENGELLIDLGFGFHPSKEAHVVGFWNVEMLHLGYGFGGYNQGITHSVCTIPSLGGIQAEMSKARRLRIHVAYRQSYNLAYEAIRGKLTRERNGFFSAESAYHLKDDYRTTIEGITGAFTRSINRSYGVRDEYRCRASIRRLFPVLILKVCGLLLPRFHNSLMTLDRHEDTWPSWTPSCGYPAISGSPSRGGV